jgi:hypothetical protein
MRLFLGLLLLFFLPGSAAAAWQGILMILAQHSVLHPLLIGMAAGLLLWFLIIKSISWLLIFEHELTHAFVALLFFRKISHIRVVSDEGGVVYHSGRFGGELGDIMITMAPYYLPTFTVVAVLVKPLIPGSWLIYYYGFIGFTFIFHLMSTIKETKNNWSNEVFPEAGSGKSSKTDIAKTGFFLSFLFIVTMSFFIHGMVFWMLAKGYHGFVPFVSKVFWVSCAFYGSVWAWFVTHVGRLSGKIMN